MRLVIERLGGFDIIESGDVERIEVENHGVRIYMTDGTDMFADREGHAESVATAAAIAVRCGTLVEALSEAPEVDGEAAMGAASAALVRERSRPWKPASEWVEGEPPRDGRWYVVTYSGKGGEFYPSTTRWDGRTWLVRDHWAGVEFKAHLPTPIPER